MAAPDADVLKRLKAAQATAKAIVEDPAIAPFVKKRKDVEPEDFGGYPTPGTAPDEEDEPDGPEYEDTVTRPVVTLTVSVSQKVQVTQYEPAEAFLSMTIRADTTPAEMDEALANGKLAWKKLTTAIVEKIGELETGQALGRTVQRKRS